MQEFDFHFLELFLIALALTCLTVLIHYVGMNWVRVYFRRRWNRDGDGPTGTRQGVMIGIVSIMMATHCVEIGAWAVLFYLRRMLPAWQTSVYFSIANYSTIGANDISLPPHWRGLGGLEAVCAMLMFGWSTALLAAVMMKLHSLDE